MAVVVVVPVVVVVTPVTPETAEVADVTEVAELTLEAVELVAAIVVSLLPQPVSSAPTAMAKEISADRWTTPPMLSAGLTLVLRALPSYG